MGEVFGNEGGTDVTNNRLLQIMKDLDACSDASAWVRDTLAGNTPEEVWNSCPRGDWLVWLISELYVQYLIRHRVLVQAACAAARTTLEDFTDEAEHDDAVKTLDAVEAYGKDPSNVAARDAIPLRFMLTVAAPTLFCERSEYPRWNVFSAVDTVCGDWNDEAVRQIANAAQDTCSRRRGPGWHHAHQRTADAVRAVVPWAEVEAALAKYVLPDTA